MHNAPSQIPPTVVYHSADFDGIFCREIARKFLPPDTKFIGWDFGDGPIDISKMDGPLYVMDLPMDKPFGSTSRAGWAVGDPQVVWIDHHKTAIDSHCPDIPGYRIDGVAACRLAWQWFQINEHNAKHPDNVAMQVPLPCKEHFIDHRVVEPLAVRLAGEYDIWDKRDPRAELFQHGLRSQELTIPEWQDWLLEPTDFSLVDKLLAQGECLRYAKTEENAAVITHQGFDIEFEGLKFLACNHARYNSFLFTAGLKPHHDACLGFKFAQGRWHVSMYHAPGKEHHDLSVIAKSYGGGGHKGACGFTLAQLPWLP